MYGKHDEKNALSVDLVKLPCFVKDITRLALLCGKDIDQIKRLHKTYPHVLEDSSQGYVVTQ